MNLLFQLTSVLIVAVASQPEPHFGDVPMQNPDLFEGDILIFDEDDRAAVVGKNRVWPNGVIPYDIDPMLDYVREKIETVMSDYEKITDGCIKFRQKKDKEYQHVRIFKGQGCYSHLGKTLGSQPLSLGYGCHSYGTIAHELGHAIGFHHEHNRSDRDDYIIVHWDHIQKGMESQFAKLSPRENILFNDFDYNSVMLYGEYVFSVDHFGKKTMEAIKEGVALAEVGDKKPSESDIHRIRKLYKCDDENV